MSASSRTIYARLKVGLLLRFLLSALSLIAIVCAAPRSRASGACCSITSINAQTGAVIAKVNATGQPFEFKVANLARLAKLRTGQSIYANFATKQVSIDGRTIFANIVAIAPAHVTFHAGPNLIPGQIIYGPVLSFGKNSRPGNPCQSNQDLMANPGGWYLTSVQGFRLVSVSFDSQNRVSITVDNCGQTQPQAAAYRFLLDMDWSMNRVMQVTADYRPPPPQSRQTVTTSAAIANYPCNGVSAIISMEIGPVAGSDHGLGGAYMYLVPNCKH